MFDNQTMSNTCLRTEWELLRHTSIHRIYLYLTPFIISIGLLGNILTVCVFILTDLKRQSVSIITIALAIVDSFVLLIPVTVLWLETILQQEFTDQSSFWCRTHGFFDLTFTCCSSWLIVCVAFERFCAVWLPHNNKNIFTHRKTFFIVLMITIFSTMTSAWFLFVVQMNDVSIDHYNQTRCTVNNDGLYDSLGMLSVLINYIFPFVFVFVLNSTVIYRLCQRGMVELTSSITVTLILICLVHLFCTLPFQLWWIYYEIPDQTGDCQWLKRKLLIRTITFTIRNLNYMANFFLYSCSSKLFRDELKSLIFLSLLPRQKYQNYSYRRQSLFDQTHQRLSLTQLILRRISRTTEVTNNGGGATIMYSATTGPILPNVPIANL